MHKVYILYSKKLNRHYVGVTSDGIDKRIAKHNDATYGEHRFTAKTDDWELKFEMECESFSQCRKIELHIKSMKSKVYIENLMKYSEMKEKLLEKFKST